MFQVERTRAYGLHSHCAICHKPLQDGEEIEFQPMQAGEWHFACAQEARLIAAEVVANS